MQLCKKKEYDSIENILNDINGANINDVSINYGVHVNEINGLIAVKQNEHYLGENINGPKYIYDTYHSIRGGGFGLGSLGKFAGLAKGKLAAAKGKLSATKGKLAGLAKGKLAAVKGQVKAHVDEQVSSAKAHVKGQVKGHIASAKAHVGENVANALGAMNAEQIHKIIDRKLNNEEYITKLYEKLYPKIEDDFAKK
jgi:hypothetical protein